MPRSLDEYLNLPYHIVLVHDEDEDGNSGWVADVSELPGCISQGATPDEAIDRIRDAMQGWISIALEDDQGVPEPLESNSFSGRFVVRLPRTLHSDISRAAEEEGVSLNQFVTGALAGAVGWRTHRRERDQVPA